MFHVLCRKAGAGGPCLGGLLFSPHEEVEDEPDGGKSKLPPPKPGSGWINDVVARATQHENGSSASLLQLLRPRLQRQLLDSAAQANFNYAPIVEAVNSENLQKQLEEVAVLFWKKADCSSRTETRRFRQQAEIIVNLRREAALLKDESEASWRRRFIIQTLKAHRVLETRESLESKLERHQQFWPKYHQVSRHSEELVEFAPQAALKGAIDWKTRAARSRGNRCPRSGNANAFVPSDSHHMGSAKSAQRLQKWQEMSDIVTDPGSACKRIRHMMIRRPLSGKGSQSKSLPRKASEMQQEASTLTLHSRPSHRKRSHGIREAMTKPSHLLKDGNIQSWGDLGLGSMGYEDRKAKAELGATPDQGRTARSSTSLQSGELKVHLEQSARSSRSPRESRYSPPKDIKPTLPTLTPVLKRPASAASLRSLKDSTSIMYLQVCESQKLLPRPAAILTGHSSKLDARHQGLTDSELEACRVPVAALAKVESVDLEGNVQLTDEAVAKFLVSLGTGPGHTLTFLSLKGCTGTSILTVASMLMLLEGQKPAFEALRYLDVSGLKFGVQALSTFCELVGQHPTLETLLVADVGLGSAGASAAGCFKSLLASQTLQELDLGWNLLDSEVFMSLGESVQHSRLRHLGISCCASVHGEHDVGKPAATFLEYLSSSCPLKELDISLNHIDYRAALVLEDLLSGNPHLTALDISFNPIGPVGMRSFVRLLMREESGLDRVRFEGCAGGKHPVGDLQFMNANSPGARYLLQLDRPDHRSVLRMLYKMCDALGVKASEAFFHMQFSEGTYKHPDVGNDGIYAVPRAGRLQATFKIEKAIHQQLKVSDHDFLDFLRQRNELMRLCPSFKKQILLLHAWRTVSDVDPDQGVFLDALARDTTLPFAVVERMCKSCLSPAEVVSKLFPAFRASASERCLTLMLARSIPDVTQILQNARSLIFFNIENPTGHYRLELSHPAEHTIAEALVLLDSWESSIRIRRRNVDTSQMGDWSQVRNIEFRGSSLQGPLTEWLMPEAGNLELDYSSSARPPIGAQVLDDKSFQNMLIALQDQNFQKKGSSNAADAEQAKLPRDDMQALRMVAHQVHITALQTRALLECFLDPCDREDCLIVFFNRIADMHNEKVFSVRFEGDDEQVNRLRARLGALIFFPWIQPEQARFVFRLDTFDERTALCALINLAKKERMTNIQKPRWVRGDGSVDPLVMGLPRSWETFSQIPTHGLVSMSYKCAPEDRNFKVRRAFLETYTNWHCDVSVDQVLWWASTSEVPVDVMEFLEFVIERYDDVYEAFDDIKSNKSTQVLNLRDFEEGLKRVKCKKFKGRREVEKITGIFRYLDPSGEGQVTRSEWGILELCHKEMVYSIQEFVHFCSRSFGNDLNAAWAVFDLNGDNFISEAEWVTVARSFAYFGPTLPIFRFLDRDDEGTISFEEFEELQKFREPPRPDVQAMLHSRDLLRANGPVMQELPTTRIQVRARLARARAALAGGRLGQQTTLMDEVILANLQALPKSTSSSLGLRVAAALQRLLSAYGVRTGRIRVLKVNSFKDGQRELLCDIGIPFSSSPCAVLRFLERALFTEEAQRPESTSLLHVLRAVSAQISTLKVEIRPSKERLVNSLRSAIPKTVILPRKVDAVVEAALKPCRIYRPVLETLHKEEPQELASLLARPSLCLHGGRLVAQEPHILKDTCWHGVRELSGLLAISPAAHLQLKDRLAPGTGWAKTAFGDAVPSRHPCRAWQSDAESLVPNALHFDPGIKKRERLFQEVLLAQRAYELQDTAAHDLWASRLHIYFETLADLCNGLACAERSLDIVWLQNRFRDPDCFGYPCVQIGVRQRVQDPRHLSRECLWDHISKITFHHKLLFEAKTGEEAAELREELNAALASCGVRSHLDLAKAAIADAMDCTEQRLRGSCDMELERVMAFLDRYAKELGEKEKGPAKALLNQVVIQAKAAGWAAAEITAKVDRCLSDEVQHALGEPEALEDNVTVASSQRPVLTRIRAVLSQYKVETVQFCFRDGSQKVFHARPLVGDVHHKEIKQPGAIAARSGNHDVIFDLEKSDYIVAVEQAAVGNSGSLGAQLLFITASGRTLHIMGLCHRRKDPLPSRVRVDVHAGEQIVGLEVEFGRLIGVETALEPAVADSESDVAG